MEYGAATLIAQGFAVVAIGAFILIISLLGYCGAIKESRILLGAYAFFLTFISILGIVAFVLFAEYRSEVELEMRNLFTASVQNFYTTRNQANVFTVGMNWAMVEGKCCGVSNSWDFDKAEHFQANKSKNPEQKIPIACCVMKGNPRDFHPVDKDCIFYPNPINSYKNNGCFDYLILTLKEYINTLLVIGVVALLHIIICTVCILYKVAFYN